MFRQSVAYLSILVNNQNYRVTANLPRFFSVQANNSDTANGGQLIKAAFAKCTKAEKASFGQSSCLITLSIGQPVHTGEYLAATLAEVNRSFKSCTFVLGDSLQRYTEALQHYDLSLSPEMNERNLYRITRQNGDNWLKENCSTMTKLTIPWKVTRWNNWLKNERYRGMLDMIRRTYYKDENFKQAFDDNVEEYLMRLRCRSELQIEESMARKLCLAYLLEECAVMCLWVEENCQFELYANGRTQAMQATFDRFIKNFYPTLLHPLAMRFKKIQNYNDLVGDAESYDMEGITAKSKILSRLFITI